MTRRHPSVVLALAIMIQGAIFTGCDDDATNTLGSVHWLRNLAGTDSASLRTVVDGQDQITLAATLRGVANLGGSGEPDLGNTEGRPVILVARYGARGHHAWSFALDGISTPGDGAGGPDVPSIVAADRIALAVTEVGDVLVAMTEHGDGIDFGEGVVNGATGVPEGMLAKFSGESGAHIWSRALFDGDDTVVIRDMAVVGSDVHVVGVVWRALDTDGSPLAVAEAGRFFAATYAIEDGQRLRGFDFAAVDGEASGDRLAVASDGTVYITGRYSGTLTVGEQLPLATSESFFLSQWGPGLEVPSRALGWAARSGELLVAVDGEVDHGVTLAGDFVLPDDTLFSELDTLDATVPLTTIAHFEAGALGEFEPAFSWAQRLGAGDDSKRVRVRDLVTDHGENILLAGEFVGALSVGADRLYSEVHNALFVVKLEPEKGLARWAHYSGGTGNVGVSDVAVDRDSNVLVAGVFETTASGVVEPEESLLEIFMLMLTP